MTSAWLLDLVVSHLLSIVGFVMGAVLIAHLLVAVAAVAGLVAVVFARRLLFTPRAQLVLPRK